MEEYWQGLAIDTGYRIGEICYLNSDLGRKTPLVVCGYLSDEFLVCSWVDERGQFKRELIPPKALTKE